MRTLALLFLSSVVATADPVPIPITGARKVLELPPQLAGSNLPVRLTGVVSATEPSWKGAFFLQDESAGIFIDSRQEPPPSAGDLLEVSGVAEPGAFAPIVGRPSWKVLGKAPLPEPRPVSLDELMTGAEDGQRVEVSGWIHRVRRENGRLYADLVSGANRVLVRLPEGLGVTEADLVGSRVSAIGVPSATSLNYRVRRMVSVNLWVHDAADFRVLQAAGPDPLLEQPTAISDLSHYKIDNSPGRRFHVRGVVTYVGDGFLYLSDETAGVKVQAGFDGDLRTGQVVDAVGFPVLDRGLPVLDDAVLVPTGETMTIDAIALNSLGQLHDGLLSGSLVKLQGRLVNSLVRDADASGNLTQLTLALESPEGIITAELRVPVQQLQDALHPMGTLLEATGVSVVSTDQNGGFQGFQLLVPSPQDLRVLQAASPFTTGRLLVALVILLVFLLGIALWNYLLLRKNTKLSGDVRERNAVLAERARLAGDLHDTLEQSLTGLGFQLQTTGKLIFNDPERAKQHLQIATGGIQQIHSELRHSIWNLTPGILTQFDLADAIARNIRQIAESAGLSFKEERRGNLPQLDPFVQQNVFRIAQEAATNSIKHARASLLTLHMEFLPQSITIAIADDGCGLGGALDAPTPGGGFGISGMKERASRVGAKIEFIPCKPHGTIVRLEMPVNPPTTPSYPLPDL